MKILYTATVLSHICQFHLPYLQALQEQGVEVHVAARNNLAEKNGLQLRYADRFINIPFQRSPKNPQNLKAYRQLKFLLSQEHYDCIICNTPMGGILTRLAAKKSRRKGTRVIYMAHGFHFYQGAPKKNWLIYYPIEKYMARLCDLIITINEEDYTLAKEKFPTPVSHIHGVGVSAKRYHPVDADAAATMRKAEGLSEHDYVILCTGELNKNKDQRTLLKAVAQLKGQIPNLKVLLAGNGPLDRELKSMAVSFELGNVVKFLGYRTDLEKVVPAVDVVASCSHREGMPLNVIEAMLCGKPLIAAVNRGTKELVKDHVNGLLFNAGDEMALSAHVLTLQDPILRGKMGHCGKEIAKAYTVASVKDELFPLLMKNTTEG